MVTDLLDLSLKLFVSSLSEEKENISFVPHAAGLFRIGLNFGKVQISYSTHNKGVDLNLCPAQLAYHLWIPGGRLNEWFRSRLLTQPVYVVSSQLVCGRVGGMQPELWRRGADEASPVRPEDQPDWRSWPVWHSVRPARPGQAASLQHAQLSASLGHRAVVAGKPVKKINK